MNKEEYAKYEKNVKEFFKKEGISNLTMGHIKCPECDVEFEDETCPECGGDYDSFNESYFSWKNCECCGGLPGNRVFATGWNDETKEIQEYSVCEDCIYYAEYGHLDDQTMLEVEGTSLLERNDSPGRRKQCLK